MFPNSVVNATLITASLKIKMTHWMAYGPHKQVKLYAVVLLVLSIVLNLSRYIQFQLQLCTVKYFTMTDGHLRNKLPVLHKQAVSEDKR